MAMTASDITGNADLFRAALPNWPHPEPETATVAAPMTHEQVNAELDRLLPFRKTYRRPGDEDRCESCLHLPGCADDCCG